jgi:AraC-like DNA-binding protein
MTRAAAARGVSSADLLASAGLTPAFLEDPDARISGPAVLAIWNALRERTSDPALQLAAPAALPFGAYRVIDYLVAASVTVGEGIERFARFFALIADAVTLRIEHQSGEHCLCLATTSGGPVPPVYVDFVFAALVTRIRMRIRPDLQVHRAEFRQLQSAVVRAYHDVFGAEVRFAAPDDRLCFSDEEWHAPTATGDAELARLLEEHARILAARIPRPPTVFLDRVQKAIAVTPVAGGSVAHVARTLHVSVRTLQRKLAVSGTTFRQVSEMVRGQLAEEYLGDPTVGIAEVAFLLGFSDQSSFNRAFRRWTGKSPGRWRRR